MNKAVQEKFGYAQSRFAKKVELVYFKRTSCQSRAPLAIIFAPNDIPWLALFLQTRYDLAGNADEKTCNMFSRQIFRGDFFFVAFFRQKAFQIQRLFGVPLKFALFDCLLTILSYIIID